jgi:hypothetical protein
VNQNSSAAVEENAVCTECGNFGALEIGGQKLCAECVTLAGSGCAGASDEIGC